MAASSMPAAVGVVLMALQGWSQGEGLSAKQQLQGRRVCCLQVPLVAYQPLLLVAVPETLHAYDV